LKPIAAPRVAQALNKYLHLREHFSGRFGSLAEALSGAGSRGPSRIVARDGPAFVAIAIEQVAWLTTEHKLTLLVDRNGRRWAVDEPLSALGERLDATRFFRLNRQHLAHIDAIAGFRSGGKGRVTVTLVPPAGNEVVVAQENVAAFRAWLTRS
jgi:DNA-binding LytR/AlgR family response regulator